MPIDIYQGSILDCDVDAIVNPANNHLAHGGGVARIIANAARDFNSHVPYFRDDGMHTGTEEDQVRALAAEWDLEQAEHPLVPTGGAGWTSAGALRYEGIIHAVGPVWGGGAYYERALLKEAHRSACAVAYDKRCRHIAIPAISCGIFGFPVEEAAPIAVNAVGDFWTLDQPNGVGLTVTFALFEQAHVDAYQAALEKRAGRAVAGL